MDRPLIEIRNFSYNYPRTSTQALKDINLTVEQDEFVGILGPTGAGKTTLCLALHGFLPQILGGKTEGSITLAGKDTKTTDISELAFSSSEKTAVVGMVFQDPESQLVGMTVEEDLAFGPENLGLPPSEIETRIGHVLETTRIAQYRDVFPYTLSGGQKQRTAIASVLVMQPQVLILDEPTSELDPIGREEVFNVVRTLKAETGLTIIMVEHDVERLVRYADRLVVMHQGQVILDGPVREVARQTDLLRSVGVRPPEVTELGEKLQEKKLLNLSDVLLDEQSATRILADHLQGAADASSH